MAQEKFNRTMANLGRSLRSMMARTKTVAFVYATVQEVNQQTNTISVSIGNEVTLPDISLAPIQGGNANALLYPKVGSVVILGFIEDRPELSFVVAFSEVDGIHIQFDYDNDPPQDSIDANATEVMIVRGDGDAVTTVSITQDSITMTTGNCKVEVTQDQVDINNGHLTIT